MALYPENVTQWTMPLGYGNVKADTPKNLLHTDSKEARLAREEDRLRLGLTKNYKLPQRPSQAYNPAVHIQDPAYFKEMGISSSNWEDEL